MENKIDFTQLKTQWWDNKKNIEYFSVGTAKPSKFLPTQYKFFNDRESKSILISGGYRSGKTDVLLRKAVLLSLIFPKNEGLLGRRTATELEVATLSHLEEICDGRLFTYKPKQMIVEFFNGSKIYLRGLDIMQSGETEMKKAIAFIRGLSLGWYAVDQAEAIEFPIIEHLDARLSRNTVPFRQAMLTSNPTNFWGYDVYKRNPHKGYRLLEVSMMENKDNLPEDYLKDQLELEHTRPRYFKQYVLGKWDEFMTSQDMVFEETTLDKLRTQVKEPIRVYEGIKIYKEPSNRSFYQIGADPSEGKHDNASFSVIDITTGEEVAKYADVVLYDIFASKIEKACQIYRVKQIVPEANNFAFIMELSKRNLPRIYQEKVMDTKDRQEKEKMGFITTRDRKIYLTENFESLVQQCKSIIYDKDTVEEFHAFVKNGAKMEARPGAHDDRVMATMLGYLDVDPEGGTKPPDALDELLKKKRTARSFI